MTDSISIRAGRAALSDVFAEPAWLAEHLNDPSVHVVEVDISRAAYEQGHTPGAALWNAYYSPWTSPLSRVHSAICERDVKPSFESTLLT